MKGLTMKRVITITLIILGVFLYLSCSGQNDNNNKSDLQVDDNTDNNNTDNNVDENNTNNSKTTVGEISYPIDGTVIGTLRLVGNEPHLELIIYGKSNFDDTSREYYIRGEDMISKLEDLVYEKVEASGEINKERIKYANSDEYVEIYSIDIKVYTILEE
jgi:hypothetical protein